MPSKQPRTTQAELQQRVSEVLHLRLHGGAFHDLLRHASEQKWNVSERQLWNYVAKADALLAETLERDRGKVFNLHVAQRRALYLKCMSVSDYSNARAVLKDEAELLGLYPAKKTEVTGKDGGPIPVEVMSDDELRATITSILAAVGQGGPDPAGTAQAVPGGSALAHPGTGHDPGRFGARPLADDVAPLDL